MERKWKTADGLATATYDGTWVRLSNGSNEVNMPMVVFEIFNACTGNPLVEVPPVDKWLEKAEAVYDAMPGISGQEDIAILAAALKSAAAEGAGEVVSLNETDAYNRGVSAERERVKALGTKCYGKPSDCGMFSAYWTPHAVNNATVPGIFIPREKLEPKP